MLLGLVTEGEKHVPPDRIGYWNQVGFRGQSGLRFRWDRKRPVAFDPDRTSLIKTKFFVGAIGRDLADPPGAPFPDHPQ
jgi:hypothetical protein